MNTQPDKLNAATTKELLKLLGSISTLSFWLLIIILALFIHVQPSSPSAAEILVKIYKTGLTAFAPWTLKITFSVIAVTFSALVCLKHKYKAAVKSSFRLFFGLLLFFISGTFILGFGILAGNNDSMMGQALLNIVAYLPLGMIVLNLLLILRVFTKCISC